MYLARSTEEAGRLEPKSTTQRQANYNDVLVYFVNQINRDDAGNVVGDRQDRENRDRRQANEEPEGRGGERSREQAGSGNPEQGTGELLERLA